MKKLIFIAFISLFLMHCFGIGTVLSPNSANDTTVINTTIGQELIDLQLALDSGAITQAEYDELKLNIIERLDAPVDSTNTI